MGTPTKAKVKIAVYLNFKYKYTATSRIHSNHSAKPSDGNLTSHSRGFDKIIQDINDVTFDGASSPEAGQTWLYRIIQIMQVFLQ